MKFNFNYIVPVFNKEDVIQDTLEAIELVAKDKSQIIVVVDGCTDNTEKIVDNFIKNSSHHCEKILMPNVHMLLSVNAGLRKVKSGYSIIMQDDILLKDKDTENIIKNLYENNSFKIGMTSFRYAANIREISIYERIRNRSFKMNIEVYDQIQSKDDWGKFPIANYGKFYPRMCAINGPNILPFNLLQSVGLFDAKLAPYGYDDTEYCIRALKLNYINGLFPIKYFSEIEWGGSRRSKEFIKNANSILLRNKRYIWDLHHSFLIEYNKKNKIYKELEFIDL